MDITECKYDTMAVEFGALKLLIDGQLSASMATILREEYPERHEPEGTYVAFDRERRKAISLDAESLILRDDLVTTPDQSVALFIRTLQALPDTINWVTGVLTVVTIGRLPVADTESLQVLISEKLLPKGIDAKRLPDVLVGGASSLFVHKDDAHLAFSLQSAFDDTNGSWVSFEMVSTWEGQVKGIDHLKAIFNRHADVLDQFFQLISDWKGV